MNESDGLNEDTARATGAGSGGDLGSEAPPTAAPSLPSALRISASSPAVAPAAGPGCASAESAAKLNAATGAASVRSVPRVRDGFIARSWSERIRQPPPERGAGAAPLQGDLTVEAEEC